VTSTNARVSYFGGGSSNGSWVPALVAPDDSSTQAVWFSGSMLPSTGSHISKASIAFGDGASENVPDVADGDFGYARDAAHAYTTAGERVAKLTVTDARGRSDYAYDFVSVAGLPSATVPGTQSWVHAVSNNLPIASFSPGANAAPLGWSVHWVTGSPLRTPTRSGTGHPPPRRRTPTWLRAPTTSS